MDKNTAEKEIEDSIDVRGVNCPYNFIKIKLKLEGMENGQILEAILDDGKPMNKVPGSIKEEGHQIIHVEKFEDGYKLNIKVTNN